MNQRLKNHDEITSTDLVKLGLNPVEADVDKAVSQLEDCVKNGLFYQAAHLSDWIAFVANKQLLEYPKLGRRVAIERLKRLGYLGFIQEEWICREEFCREYKLNDVISSASIHHDNDELRFHLFTAIGHTLWHTEDINTFNKDVSTCQLLHNGLTDTEGNGKNIVKAFLNGLWGRQSYLKRESVHEVMKHFDISLALLNEKIQKSRAGLHLIIYYTKHLLHYYKISDRNPDEKEMLSNKIDGLLCKFEECRLGIATKGGLQPLKTLLQINFLILKLGKLHIDRITDKIKDTRTELLFTSIMLGLSNLNPCPPLLREIHEYANDQRDLFDVTRAKKYLKEMIRKIDWRSMEKLVIVYYEQQGYNVIDLPENAPTFDLLVEKPRTATNSITGVQVKHWKKKISADAFRKWREKARDYEGRNKISEVIFFLTHKLDQSVNINLETLESIFPKITNEIQIISLDDAINQLWQQPGCLPSVYGIISANT